MPLDGPPPHLPPAGWYDDPEGPGQRWWDGAKWGENRRGANSQPSHIPTPTPQAPRPLGFGAKVVLAIVALVLVGGVRELAGCGGDSAEAEWTGIGRVCDFDGECQEDFKCRSLNGAVEIYLPYGSFATGNEGWEWQEDSGERCGEPPA